mgnify:CR=1 FL=1
MAGAAFPKKDPALIRPAAADGLDARVLPEPGDKVKSAGLLVVDRQAWPLVDLRCDWADDPIGDGLTAEDQLTLSSTWAYSLAKGR